MIAKSLLAFVIVGTASLGAQQRSNGADSAVISGHVVASDSGRPVGGAVLRLVPNEGVRTPRTALTDDQGRFEYSGLAPGRYQLQVTAEGYLTLEFGQRAPNEPGQPIDLSSGQRFDRADVGLPRTSTIEGIVTDEYGDPAPSIYVQASQVEFVAGRRRLMPVSTGNIKVLTDDKGYYRLSNISPGDYFITASAGGFVDSSANGGFAITYFPGTTDPFGAKSLRVGVSRDLSGISFPLVPARTSRVSGVVVDQAGSPVSGGTLVLASSDSGTLAKSANARTASNADGTFVFRNIPPGNYALQAIGLSSGNSVAGAPSALTPVVINGSDRDGISLRVVKGATASGRIVFERIGVTPEPRPTDVRVAFAPADDSRPVTVNGTAIVNSDWTFAASSVFDSAVIRVNVRSADWVVKRVTLNGREIVDTPIDFKSGDVSGLEVLMSDRVSGITGTVETVDRRPSANYAVVLFPADESRLRYPSRYVQLVRPNQDGAFKISSIPPEDYRIIALPVVVGGEWQDPEFIAKLRPKAVSISVLEGESKRISLTLVPRPD